MVIAVSSKEDEGVTPEIQYAKVPPNDLETAMQSGGTERAVPRTDGCGRMMHGIQKKPRQTSIRSFLVSQTVEQRSKAWETSSKLKRNTER